MIADGKEEVFVGQGLVERLYLQPGGYITSWPAFLPHWILPLSPTFFSSTVPFHIQRWR